MPTVHVKDAAEFKAPPVSFWPLLPAGHGKAIVEMEDTDRWSDLLLFRTALNTVQYASFIGWHADSMTCR